jgi:prolyl-tRNA synthetase
VLNTTPAQMIKTLVYVGTAIRKQERPDPSATGTDTGPTRPADKPAHHTSSAGGAEVLVGQILHVVALVRGDREVNEIKLNRLAGLTIELADPQTIENITGAKVGFAGPQGLIDRIDRLIVDREVALMRNAATGANKTDFHVTGVNPGRDFPLDHPKVVVGDIRTVCDGDPSPTGSGSPLRLKTAIEVGHVFKLGTKYSQAMRATYLDQHGQAHPFLMGCYGIGLNRILAAAIEAHHDENGIIWPISIAPFEALILCLDPSDEAAMKVATDLYDRLSAASAQHDGLNAAGIDVLFDDRDERAGFKFKDADLIGVPLRIVVGKKSLAAGGVEVSHRRRPGEKQLMPAGAAVDYVISQIREERARLSEPRS